MIKNTIILCLLFYASLLNYINRGLYVALENTPKVKLIPLGVLNVTELPHPEQFDYILKKNKWYCSLKGKTFTWSKAEIDNTKVYQYYLGATKGCMRYEREGAI